MGWVSWSDCDLSESPGPEKATKGGSKKRHGQNHQTHASCRSMSFPEPAEATKSYQEPPEPQRPLEQQEQEKHRPHRRTPTLPASAVQPSPVPSGGSWVAAVVFAGPPKRILHSLGLAYQIRDFICTIAASASVRCCALLRGPVRNTVHALVPAGVPGTWEGGSIVWDCNRTSRRLHPLHGIAIHVRTSVK